MACEYRDYPDFPKRGLPLRSWPDLARIMSRISLYAPCDHEYDSIIVDQISIVSLITSSLSINSIITDEIELYSLIC